NVGGNVGVVRRHRAATVLLDGQQAAEHAQCLVSEATPLRRCCTGPSPPLLPANKLLVEGIRRHRLLPREVSRQHAEEKYAKRPHVCTIVHTKALLPSRVAQLGCSVRYGAAHPLNRRASPPRHTEVRKLDLPALLVEDENVLRLDVSMHQLLAVQVVQGDGHLVHASLGHALWETHLRRGKKKQKTER
uniref:Uncharacterized protein n=1 Tax=Astyanax mexicanus TaxID=7994 RepID=A0A8B9GVC5_ASTMX